MENIFNSCPLRKTLKQQNSWQKIKYRTKIVSEHDKYDLEPFLLNKEPFSWLSFLTDLESSLLNLRKSFEGNLKSQTLNQHIQGYPKQRME